MIPSESHADGIEVSLLPADVNGSAPEHGHLVVNGFVDFSHTGDAFALALTIFMVGMFKTVVARVTFVPNSVMLIIAGVFTGLIINYTYPGEIYLKPSWFFYYLLPVIVFEAGFCMKNKDFFSNLGTILLFAVAGTILNVAMLVSGLWIFHDTYESTLNLAEIILFSVIICAVDPVAVLTVFEDIKVNELLYICVFGESLLNDAVTIVLYQSMADVKPGMDVGIMDFLMLVYEFFFVAIGGIGFGIFFGYLQAGLCRLFVKEQQVQPILLLFIPYILYLLADSFKVSGLLALIICGMISKNYAEPNISEDLMRFSEVLLKFLCSYAESFIFVFLGISLWSTHIIDPVFIAFTLIGIIVARFICTFFLCALSNSFRAKCEHIGFRDQFIMAYGGLRGAVCYGLVMSLPDEMKVKKMLVTTTIFVVAFTTIFQGSTIRACVQRLQVRLSKKCDKEAAHDNPYKVFGLVHKEVQKRVVSFIEDLTQARRQNFIYHKFMEIDEKYIKPFFIAGYERHSYLGDQHKLIEIEEYTEGIRCGSFAGLPHVGSQAKIAHSFSNNDVKINGTTDIERGSLLLKVPDRPIPRNESISGLVQQTFNNVEWDLSLRSREPRRSIYSRHQLEVPPSPAPYLDEDSFDERNYIFTYPGPKPLDRGQLARDIKAFAARQRTGKSPSRRRPNSMSEGHSARSAPPGVNSSRSVRVVPRFQLTTEDELEGTSTDPMPTARTVRTEKKLSSGGKTFVIGGEEAFELMPIHEEDSHDESHDETDRQSRHSS
ncbi:hypothetical protein PMAYCL1PPCAC_33251 [Pristionchus mayeri]|uniref:Sodium/hydrogen exchanger n=1 Tax=Pristionchus mayeri TaxID=1317129 RepID=A0AAN5DHD1_9BILA|nr:hypothetical protein PMAYCL1PPCAC_33251 [Pristionchus mayeri]